MADLALIRAARIGFTTTYKTAGTAKIRGNRTRHHSLWVGLWVERVHKFFGNQQYFLEIRSSVEICFMRRRFEKPSLGRTENGEISRAGNDLALLQNAREKCSSLFSTCSASLSVYVPVNSSNSCGIPLVVRAASRSCACTKSAGLKSCVPMVSSFLQRKYDFRGRHSE
jgi:hypothetical protein